MNHERTDNIENTQKNTHAYFWIYHDDFAGNVDNLSKTVITTIC